MKRAVTAWQVVVLFLVALMTVGIYVLLALAWYRPWDEGKALDAAPVVQSGAAVQIMEPLDGAVLYRSSALPVRAALMEPGFVQAELQVDGMSVALQVNPDPPAAPRIVQWVWEDVVEGSHVLVVRARQAGGQEEVSAPVRVTAVPMGTLFFSSNRDGAYAIYAVETNGRDLVRLTVGPGDAMAPALGPGGGLVFVTEGEGGSTTIRQLTSAGEGGTALVAGRDPAWSRDGTRLAYAASPKGVSQVLVLPQAGEIPVQLTEEEVYAGQPSWSPDGTRLAYVVEREGNLDIWVAAVDGSESTRVTDDPATDWMPAWSPDGSQVAFVSDRDGVFQVYVMGVDGSGVRRLTDCPRGAESPAWSPDGFWLAFVAYAGDGPGVNAREIHLIRADGQSQVRLTHDSADDTDPEWAREPRARW